MTYQPKVILVDDHELVRAGIKSSLADRVHVIGEASDISEAIDIIEERNPEVVLLDVHLPSGSGVEVITAIKKTACSTQFLALSASDAPKDVLQLIRAGARGYVTKSIATDELVEAVIRVAEGDAYFSPRLAGFVLDAFSNEQSEPTDPDALEVLTPREQEVMRLLARGYAYKEIASRLTISIKTVETHASSVLKKLQVSNRYELTRWANKNKIY